MSCDYLARHAIATFGAGCTPAERSYLQAVYDQPVALKPGEDKATLSRAAQGLVLRLKAARADIPAHLDVKDTASRGLVRYGRLALALTELQQRQQARQQADEPPTPTWGAWMRVALADDQPSRALKALQASGKITDYPHLAALEGLEHDPYWHPEGGPFDHTWMVTDEAAAIAERDGLNAHDRTVLVLTAVGHDFGKAGTTQEYWEKAPAGEGGAAPPVGRGPAWQPDGNGGYHRRRIGSRGHEAAGEPLAEAWLRQIGAPEEVIAEVKPLVRLHLEHIKPVWKSRDLEAARGRGEDVTALQAEFDRMVQDLAEQVKPSSLGQLARVIEADYSGRHPWPKDNPAAPIVARARELGLEPPAGGPAQHCPRCGRFLAADGSHSGECSVQETFDGWYAEVRAAAAGGAISAEVAQVLRVTASDLLGNPRLDPALSAVAAALRDNSEQPEALRAMASALVQVRQQTRPERGLLDLYGWKPASSRYGVAYVEVEPRPNGSTVARVALNDGEGFTHEYDGYDARGNDQALGELENGVLSQVDDHPALLRLAATGVRPSVTVEDGAVVLEFPASPAK